MSDENLGGAAGHAPAPPQQVATDDGMPVPPADATSGGAAEEGTVTEDQVRAALRKVKDPELNLNIVDLGLIYAIAVEGSRVSIDMSLTSPGCPSGPEIMTSAEQQLRAMPGVEDVVMNLVWQPFWSPERIEPRIRSYLGL
ncbi:MAG: metal-sulfur cluster assembly factor [Gemmatimonadaceae bacterium]